ncbi:hypothetical protein CONCODRAFT_82691 [Conidiobolus coronatus NRRL 28638]|uniref:Uncharacterized protein n=1 Tax=Conidiobolus coronatus (strain ATCC 28846 / CBS 209.66 / NRRL 28638) TaxID=796925 RepID=A0A137PID7_CONC2|nr:hypothetical protein CONCODRAFT_82691 [Conidiobolus coronatus NRRL 28638]|eukprot:KXN74745.1 hypothetical protein CONCODRAFT_82691 [Conidiobolus coronatus NRRL 28638]
MIKLYELVTKENGYSASPYVILAELFLKHKGLEYEKISLRPSQVGPTIREITNGKWNLVPTVVFPNGDIVFDSPEVGKYLDEKYPENPLDPNNAELDALIEAYANTNLAGFRMAINDLYELFEGEDKAYFKESREQRYGIKFSQIPGDRDVNLNNFYKGTQPIDKVLANSKFLDGESPKIHDYAIAARIQCFRTASPKTYKEVIVNNPNENFRRWVGDMDKVLDGFLANRKILKI